MFISSHSSLKWFKAHGLSTMINLVSSDYYYFLQINEDWSGEFTRSLGHKPITRTFTKEDVIVRNGYIEITASPSEKMVLPAWVLPSGSERLTGQLFMYKEDGELFNMLYYPLDLVMPNSALLEQDNISKLYRKYHQQRQPDDQT